MGRGFKKTTSLLMLLVFAASLALAPGRSWAQSSDDDAADADFGLDTGEDDFVESGADAMVPSGQAEEDFTEGAQYVDEATPSAAGAAGGALNVRQAQARIRQERSMFPLNAGWGAATGLMIGGWFALINAGSNRATLQNVGTGIVLGATLGLFVGARTVINPDAPQAAPAQGANDAVPSTQPSATPLVSLDAQGVKLGILLTF
jgi:hypothetical protein